MPSARRYALLFVVAALSCYTAVRGQTAPAPAASLPDIVAEVNGEKILKAELLPHLASDEALRRAIDRKLVEQQAKKEGITDKATTRQYMATMMLANFYQQKIGLTAPGRWLIAHLESGAVSINGKAIAPDIFEDSIEAAMSEAATEREVTLFGTIETMVTGQGNVKDETVKERLRNAVLNVAGVEFVLGEMPPWQSIDYMKTNALRDVMLITTVKDHFLAAEAREKGIDKDPDFQQQRDRILTHMTAGSGDQVDVYYKQHDLSEANFRVTDSEVKMAHKALAQVLMQIGTGAGTNALREYLQALKKDVAGHAVELTDAELEAFCQMIVTTALIRDVDGTLDPVRTHLQRAKLRWAREPHHQMLRDKASIKILAGNND